MSQDLTTATVHFDKFQMRLNLFAGSDMLNRIAAHGVWERHITQFMGRVLPQMKQPLFLDVGANIGYFTVLAANLGARVLAFEPNPNVRPVLLRNILENRCADVAVDPRIVGDGAQRVRLVQPEGFYEGGYAVAAGGGEADASVSIDAYCAETDARPGFIKCDAEGLDLDMIQGALATLDRDGSIVVFEFQPAKLARLSANAPEKVFASLREIGYTPHLFRGHSSAAAELVDFEILQRIYDLYAGRDIKGMWDVLLWPPRLKPLAQPYVPA